MPSGSNDYQWHHDDRKSVVATIRQAKRDSDFLDPATKPRQLDAPCWVVQCDGECETVLDTEDEGYVFHHLTRADAAETVAAYEWRYAGTMVFCEDDAPADGQLPPLSPAEQEAAGQLVIPGVLP
jgi:hypothetical protein